MAAGDAVEQYAGWKKGIDPETERIQKKKASFKLALQSGVTIGFGGDVGVYSHGENYRELELMVDYGMSPLKVLQAATSVNARTFHLENLGEIKTGFIADLIAVQGNPAKDITKLQNVQFVMQAGKIFKE